MSYRSGVALCIGASTAELRRVVSVTLPDERIFFEREGGNLWNKCSLVAFSVLMVSAEWCGYQIRLGLYSTLGESLNGAVAK